MHLAKQGESRLRRWGHQLQNQFANRLRFMLAERTRKAIGPFESVWPLNSHLPVLRRPRSSNADAPLTLSVAECVFDTRADIATQLSIPEILQLNRHSHRIAILSKAECPFAVQSGERRVERAHEQIMNSLIHNSC